MSSDIGNRRLYAHHRPSSLRTRSDLPSVCSKVYQTFVEQVLDLAVDLRFECVWHTVGTHLPWHELVGGLDSMHHRVAPPWSVVELVGEIVEQLVEFLTLVGLKMRDLVVLDSLTGQQTTRHNRYGS